MKTERIKSTKQVVNHVIDGINNGSYKKGDWNSLYQSNFRKNYNLSKRYGIRRF